MRAILPFLLTTVFAFAEEAPESKDSSQAEWVSLFDGKTLQGWQNGNGQPAKVGRWTIADGVLSRSEKGAGQLYSAKEYGDFEFSFEWNLSQGGNSGVKYRVQEIDGKMLGLEYQLLDDDNHVDNKNPTHLTAALYDLKTTIPDKPMNPIGEWNTSRIVVKEGLVQHYLNGTLVVELEIPSAEWEERFTKSKYRDAKGFGVNAKGRLMLQDHNDPVSFRNLKIREF